MCWSRRRRNKRAALRNLPDFCAPLDADFHSHLSNSPGAWDVCKDHILTDQQEERIDVVHIELELLKEPRCRNDHFCS